MLASCFESCQNEHTCRKHEPFQDDGRSWKSVAWMERNEAHDRIELAPGACLANEPTWPFPAFLLAGFRLGGDAHGWDSGTGGVCCRACDVYPRGRTRSPRCPIGDLPGPHPGEDLGHARHLTPPLGKRTPAVCRGAGLAS